MESEKMVCYHHPSQQAVVQCSKCGKSICKNCSEAYGITSGEYTGKSLCYNCISQLVESNITETNKLKKETKLFGTWIFSNFGLIILKALGKCISGGGDLGARGDYRGLGKIIGGTITLLISPIKAIIEVINRSNKIKRLNEIVASNSQTLEEIRTYFAYTQAIEKNAGVDLAKLAEQGGELFENTFAKIVLGEGEKAALEKLHRNLAQIVANAETIRNFG
ncbi:MAG: IBR domain-containing protein [Fibromonadaceae bacterium]|jgi:hypothetical protein|nr:IBR domain-containing protein [Fibromonadaceae bacterium]